MMLRLSVPGAIVLETEATKIVAEGPFGCFGILPRHIDVATPLVAGLLGITRPDGGEEFIAVDEGILVKVGDTIRVSVRDAVRGPELGELGRAARERFRIRDEREARARSALDRLEAHLVRRFIDLGEHRG